METASRFHEKRQHFTWYYAKFNPFAFCDSILTGDSVLRYGKSCVFKFTNSIGVTLLTHKIRLKLKQFKSLGLIH